MKRILLAATAALLLTGCEKEFLEKEPLSVVTPDNFYKTSNDAVRAINAAYKPLTLQGVGQFGLDRYGNYMSGDAQSANDDANWSQIQEFTVTSDNQNVRNSWNAFYQGIFRANLVLDRVPAIAMDEGLKQRILGEAAFLRAINYHYLVLLFGDVPLITKPQFDVKEFLVSRTPTEQVYQQIISDLKIAETSLPRTYAAADVGRATQGAAKAFLAKVYLYRKQWPEAAAKAKEVIDANTYSLFDRYFDNFELATENGKESIFEIQYASFLGGLGNATNNYDAPRGLGFTLDGGYGYGSPTKNFVNSFAPNDPRLSYSVFRAGDVFQGIAYNPAASPTGYSPRKYVVGKGANIGKSDDPKNFILMRYADLLLMYAEALNEAGKPSEAAAPVNQVRARADVKLAPLATTLSQSQMRQAIKDERRAELGLEGHRWFDLVRWGDAATYLKSIGKTGYRDGVSDRLPIPQAERDINPNLTQNNGY
ncbi:RagB/SusD family nutrient uptake outer membrane protein [Hymenobacter sp. GOD-10R]|uniref:RagB/SusD family nutrient uptake outer membrane protein n=1 Tax=Hymenobacter sp. GOD-10R TaxID=3093922 RepID=UPI002D79ED97|nr:RagB/SusD family nutrient uptake outer membrane protein [Hymenobacter sp. GOD-10R]WRQ31548.1 RagB/SusD family nutrient uptake outer membrane protein [Hymenobacter sp. GOD-10R]